ncbi:MFS transporter [Mycobacterium sp. SP-6446]|uniref:MFS transporter n=1 Tax=Mycobacterium sp. SP-6446 TaxID=1834162 RepID=UPI0011156B13
MSDPMPIESTTQGRTSSESEAMPSRRFIAAIVALGGMQLMSMMNGTIMIAALPRIQNELNLSDAERSWVLTAYVLSFGGLMLVGGRIGDTIGRKRAFIAGVALFTVTSAVCGIARNGDTLIAARLVQGVAGATIAPTIMALVATTFPKGPTRNTAMAVLGAVGSISSVLSLVVGGALADFAWRLVFVLNVAIGVLVIYLARTALRETQLERMKLDVTGAGLATLTCIAAVVAFSMGPEKGWLSAPTIGAGVLALGAFVAFIVVERSAANPIVPFDLFFDRNRLATFATIFLAGGVLFSVSVLVTLYALNIMGYSALRAGIGFIPFALAVGVGVGVSSKLVTRFPPRVLVVAGGVLLVGAMLYSTTLHRGIPYFPNLVIPLIVGGIGIGLANVPLGLSVIAGVGSDRIGPTSAISLMLMVLGGPVLLAVVQAAVTSRTLALGGTTGPVKLMNPAQLHALDQGYTYGLLWLAGVSVLVGAVALFIGYTAQQVAQAQEAKKAIDAGQP